MLWLCSLHPCRPNPALALALTFESPVTWTTKSRREERLVLLALYLDAEINGEMNGESNGETAAAASYPQPSSYP